jgi:NADH-quinone oxidoreductase subunit L
VVGLVTALLTAYYMTRQVILVFYGKARWHDAHEEHGAHGDFEPHESPKVMLLPLVVLAALSAIGGVIQLPFGDRFHFLEKWLAPVTEFAEADIHATWAYENKWLLLAVAIVVAFTGILISIAVYGRHKIKAVEPVILENGWYYDRAVSNFMGGPGRRGFAAIAWFDANIIDGAVNGVARVVRGSAGVARKAQSGYVRQYVAAVGVGVVLLLVWFVVVRGIV